MQSKTKPLYKKVTVVLLLFFVLTMVLPTSAFAASFSDVPSNHWALQQIERMSARGVIAGYQDGTAKPNNPVTQFEAVLMASRMMGLTYDESTSKGTYLPFTYPDWTGAYGSAVAAYEAGLIDANDFNHSGAASREWVAKLLIKALGAEEELSSAAETSLSFSDTDQIGSNYLNYVKLAWNKGLIGGYTDGTFKPKNTVTRAEMVAFLCRVEDKLGVSGENVVNGKVTAISGVNVTIAGNDGKSYSLYATTNSVLYDKNAKKIGVTDLAVDDPVYAVYRNSLLNYLEVRDAASLQPGPGTTPGEVEETFDLSGTIRSLIRDKQTLVLSDEDGQLQTVLVDEDTVINEEGSTVALKFTDLQVDMTVKAAVNAEDQTASHIVVQPTVDGQKGGTIYSVDIYENLIVMDERTGLKTYPMSKNIEVSISGMLTATTSSLKPGDQATYTISNGTMVAIAVGGSDSYGGNATVRSVDTNNRILNYLTSSNELKAAYYKNGLAVQFKGSESGTVSDLQVGDTVNLTVENNQITAITVTNRGLTEGAIKGTLYSVNTEDNLITITDGSNTLKPYILAENVRVTLYDESASLGSLRRGMRVELTLQNERVTRIKANNLVDGVVEAVNNSARTIEIKTDNGTEVYDVSDTVQVNFYRSSSSRLNSVDIGDTVSMRLVNDEVTEINVNEQINMTVLDVYRNGGWIRLEDENGNVVSTDVEDVEVIVDDIHTSYINDLSIGDAVLATFNGNTLVKIEAVSQVKGEVLRVNTNTNTLSVRTFGNDTKTVQFTNGSYVVKNGANYTNLNTINEGDRIIVNPGTDSGRAITVMNSKTGLVRYATRGYLQFLSDDLGYSYTTINGCYCHYRNSTSQFTLDNLTRNESVTIYFTDRNSVYEVVRN